MPKINPCKKCGNKFPEILSAQDEKWIVTGWYVTCPICGLSGPTDRTREEAVIAWNKMMSAFTREIYENDNQ